jgi:hypothetical protein
MELHTPHFFPSQITEGLTARSFLIKAIFVSSPAVVGLDILVAVYINQSIFDSIQHA